MKESSIKTTTTFKYEQAKGNQYCKKCGQPLIFSDIGSDGEKTDPAWEAMNGMHLACYQKLQMQIERELKAKQAELKDPEEEERKSAPISAELLAKYAKRPEKKEDAESQDK